MLYIISIETFGDYNVHDIQTNSCWCECVLDGYASIPDELVEGILATNGYCDLVLNEDQTEVVSFTARECPDIPVVPPTLVTSWALNVEPQKYTISLNLADGTTDTHVIETDINDWPTKLIVNGTEIPGTVTGV